MPLFSPTALTAINCFLDVDHIESVTELGNAGGFSGSKLWRVDVPNSCLCLRRWPSEHPTSQRLAWIHQVLNHAATNGLDILPIPLKTRRGDTFCSVASHLWELTPWMSGKADYWSRPEDGKLAAAMTKLAEFHQAVSDLGPAGHAPAPGLLTRRDQLRRWREVNQGELTARMSQPPQTPLTGTAHAMIQLMPALYDDCASSLESALRTPVALQPCIRDIWHDHLLFDDGVLTAIVDFGAMHIDSITLDVTRLLGSLVADDARGWSQGLEAYQRVRRLTDAERALLAVVDQANTVLSAANWLRWLFIEQRKFENINTVQARMDKILERLRFRCTSSGDSRVFG